MEGVGQIIKVRIFSPDYQLPPPLIAVSCTEQPQSGLVYNNRFNSETDLQNVVYRTKQIFKFVLSN